MKQSAVPYPRAVKAWLTVIILTLLYGVATLDRQIVAILVTPIKADLALTDVQIGLAQGAFAIFFTFASLPIGWLIDRARRKFVILCGTMLWGLAATATGLVSSFAQFFVVRAAVGVGEATLQPTAFTILSDLFPPGRLALPLSLFVIGSNIGNGASYILGGLLLAWLGQGNAAPLPLIGGLAAWKQVFMLMGIPGILLALPALLIHDRRRPAPNADRPAPQSWADLGRHYLGNIRFYIGHHLGFTMCMAFAIGLLSWNPAYLNRHYGWDFATIGLYLGGSQIIVAIVGLSCHGWLIDRLYRAGMTDIHLRYFVVMCPLAGIFAAIGYSLDNPWLTLLFFNIGYFCLIGYPGIGAASLQIATPAALRGRASAVYLICLNLVGAFGGPLIIALLTDRWFGDERRLGASLATFSILVMAIATLSFLFGIRAKKSGLAENRSA